MSLGHQGCRRANKNYIIYYSYLHEQSDNNDFQTQKLLQSLTNDLVLSTKENESWLEQ